MRFLNKYKIHENFASGSLKLPFRVFKFKRPKWAKVKIKLKKSLRKFEWILGKRQKKRIPFPNLLNVRIPRILYCNKIFSKKLQTRKYLASIYDNSCRYKIDKKQKSRRKVISSVLVKPLYRIDLFLWYLKIFSSSWEARQVINNKKIYVNSKCVKLNHQIKMGDIISFNFSQSDEDKNAYVLLKKKFMRTKKSFPFLEYDYYTNTFIVLKDWIHFSKNDFSLMFRENKNVKYVTYK